MIPLLQTDRVRASEKQKSTDKTPPSRRYFVGFVSPFWRLRQPKPPLSTNNSIDFVDQFHWFRWPIPLKSSNNSNGLVPPFCRFSFIYLPSFFHLFAVFPSFICRLFFSFPVFLPRIAGILVRNNYHESCIHLETDAIPVPIFSLPTQKIPLSSWNICWPLTTMTPTPTTSSTLRKTERVMTNSSTSTDQHMNTCFAMSVLQNALGTTRKGRKEQKKNVKSTIFAHLMFCV